MVEYIREAVDRLKAQRGQALSEYTLILAFVAIGSVVVLGTLGLLLAGNIDSLVPFFPPTS